jgi:pentapeptide MXKDX repeat protein
MSESERFSKFFFGILLVISFLLPCGKWLALLVGALFLVSSVHGLCVGCKCKQFLNTKKQGEEAMKSKLTVLLALVGFSIATAVFAQDAMKADAPKADDMKATDTMKPADTMDKNEMANTETNEGAAMDDAGSAGTMEPAENMEAASNTEAMNSETMNTEATGNTEAPAAPASNGY